MEGRRYYSIRTGQNQSKLDLVTLKKLFLATYRQFEEKHYFQEAFGGCAKDRDRVHGEVGTNIDAYFFRRLRKQNLWPIVLNLNRYSEDDLFDIIELLYDLVSKPMTNFTKLCPDCGGNHYYLFDKASGQLEFRREINEFLQDYRDGYQLSGGEILSICDPGLEGLLEAEVPTLDPDNVDGRLKQAVLKYRRHSSSDEEKRESVRALADILEYLKKKYGTSLVKADESDLFQIANRFGIRHHDPRQNTDYDAATWLPWMFYIYLASIHLSIRLIQRANSEEDED